MRALFLAVAVACAIGAYIQSQPRVDCNAFSWKYHAPAPRAGSVPLAPPPMSREKCEKDAASFQARGLEVPTLPRTTRPGLWLFAIGGVASLAVAARREA